MLNRAKVLRELQSVSTSLFLDLSEEFLCAKEVWREICSDPLFAVKCAQASSPWMVPTWCGNLEESFLIHASPEYYVLAADGSQIYPDRHQGTSCFLINIGLVNLRYGRKPLARFESEPYVFVPDNQDEQINHIELVNCKRQELELRLAWESINLNEGPDIFLFDGSLIFWHLEGKHEDVKKKFVGNYLQTMQEFFENQILMAGYISLPKSKELLNLLRLQLSNFQPSTNESYKKIDHLIDSHVASFYLNESYRSIVFASSSPIIDYYPEPLKPYFFYVNAYHEIIRIEVPQWIAQDDDKVNKVASIILDQTVKGHGYPVSLAESHEQAVVKGPDREFFYHCIQKLGYQEKKHLSFSQKSMKKRRIGI